MKAEHKDLALRTIAGIEALGFSFLGPRAAILRDPAEDVTRGGIIIPDEAKRKLPKGTVVALGSGADFDDEQLRHFVCEKGDRVLFSKYGGNTFAVTLPDGREVELELISVMDVYIRMGNILS